MTLVAVAKHALTDHALTDEVWASPCNTKTVRAFPREKLRFRRPLSAKEERFVVAADGNGTGSTDGPGKISVYDVVPSVSWKLIGFVHCTYCPRLKSARDEPNADCSSSLVTVIA